MATILNDVELAKLMGAILHDGDASSIRPNSYVLRLGAVGEYLNTGKEFDLNAKKKTGIRVPAGYAVGVTSMESIDFRQETVDRVFPGCSLHGMISPTTDLAREGIIAPSTHVDAGYHGTLNWTLTNTSSEERKFVLGERLFRLVLFRLEPGETAKELYSGDYQNQHGYVRSRRAGPPVGMKSTEFHDPYEKGGPEDLLDDLIKSGYPWNLLGTQLKTIDRRFEEVTLEYGRIGEAINSLREEVSGLGGRQGGLTESVRTVMREEADNLQVRWLLKSGYLVLGLIGTLLTIASNATLYSFIKDNAPLIGLLLLGTAFIAWIITSRVGRTKK